MADLPIAVEKGGSRRRGGGGGVRPALVLLAGGALVMMALQLKPPNSSLLDQLNVPHSTDVAAWALGSDSGIRNHARNMWQGDTAAPALGEQFLSFQVCGDPAHQRVAVLSGEGQRRISADQTDGCRPTAGPQAGGIHARHCVTACLHGHLKRQLAMPLAGSSCHATMWTGTLGGAHPNHSLHMRPCQRRAGIVLAAEVNRTAVLPRLLMGSRAVEFGCVAYACSLALHAA